MANTKITSRVLADDAVLTANITDANVTTAKIANANVTVAKMAANSVDSDQYVDGSIDTAHIAADQITTALIADDVGLGGNPTTSTQLGANSTTRIATTAFVQQELTTLIGGAPSTLNDLNELAAAINDDANYNSTLTTALATKLPLAGGTLTGVVQASSANAIDIGANGNEFRTLYLDTSLIASNALSIATGTDLTLDAAGNITLDTDGGHVYLKDGGTQWGRIFTSGTPDNFFIESSIQDKDIIFKGNDGGTAITALTLDMSAAGAATFNSGVSATSYTATSMGVTKWYQASNSGNPEFYIGAADTNRLGIQTVYHSAAQTLANVHFFTQTSHVGANAGYMTFSVDDGAEKFRIDDAGVDVTGTLGVTGVTTIANTSAANVNNESHVLIRNLANGNIVTDGLTFNCAEDKLGVGTNMFISGGYIRSGTADLGFGTASMGQIMVLSNTYGNVTFETTSGGGQGTPRSISHNANGRSYYTGGAEAIYIGGATASESGRSTFRVSEGNNNMEATIGGDISWVLMHDGKVKYNNSSTYTGHGNFIGEVGASMKAVMFERTNGGGEVGSIVTNVSSTTYNTSSDYRLKENVDYTWDATTRLKQLKPARFNWIVDDTNTLLEGFLAHEVSSIVPEAVYGTKDGMTDPILYIEGENLPEGKSVGDIKVASAPDYQGIDQSKLVPLLVKTIQELEARIATLEG